MTITLLKLTDDWNRTGTVQWDKHTAYNFAVYDVLGDQLVAKHSYGTKEAAARALRRWMRGHSPCECGKAIGVTCCARTFATAEQAEAHEAKHQRKI